MRPYLLLIAVALLTAFAAGTLSLDLARGAQPEEADAPNLALLKARFEAQHTPMLKVDLSDLVPPGDGLKLLDPREALPQSQRFDPIQLGALVRFSSTCATDDAEAVTSFELAKALRWHRFSCGELALPPSFFEAPPFMHPAGASFASLGAARFGEAWRLEHQGLLHATEWRPVLGLEPSRALLASLSDTALLALASTQPLVLDAEYVLIGRTGSAATRRYAAYRRTEWDTFLSRSAYIARPSRDGEACVATEGAVCWVRNEAPYFARLSRLTVMLLVLALGSAAAAGTLLLRRVRTQRAEEDRQRFVLQTLTHELRTPVSSLLLSLESLRAGFDTLTAEGQRDLLRIIDDANRLRRLAERSRAYLSSAPAGQLLALTKTPVDSLGRFVEQALDSYRERITVELGADGAGPIDTYWVATCLTNLVENALAHGAAPVTVKSELSTTHWLLTVSDAGRFVSHSPHAGLGLGLSIVRRAAHAMGGKLDFDEAPTRFTLRIPR